MTILNPSQIAQLAYNAGFRGSALRMAVAVAMAESRGNTNAYNPETAAGTAPNHGSRGLWQIYGTAHPQYDNAQAFNPQINADAAFEVYREAGNRFTPWSTYNNGSAFVISQSLNLDIPTGQIQFDPGTSPLLGQSQGGVKGKGAQPKLAPILQSAVDTQATATQYVESSAQSAGQGLVNVSLLPANITQAIQNADPAFWKDTTVVFFLGLIFLGLGGAILLALIARPVAGVALKGAETAAAVGAL